jgi:YrhK-like protein
MSVLFAVGSLCFAAAAVASQWGSSSRPAIGVTFFVGSIFFTCASYLQYAETVNVEHRLDPRGRRHRWRPASWEPGRIDWLAASIQLVGTIFFNVSTFTAMKHGLSAHQSNRRVWAPDALGSICFLVSSELAYAEVCHRWLCLRGRSLSWRIVALNLLGSIAFGVAAIASLLEPSGGEPISARVTNAGTALGGLCFLVAALALMPEAASEERGAQGAPRPGPGLPPTIRK